jgi:chromate reductase, NAD(P)H dehydrogenase (quinone)
MKQIKILAIPGSLRSSSANIQLLHNLAKLAPASIVFDIYNGLGSIPPFDDSTASPAIEEWRRAIRDADGILICTPEYAFGVSGVLKNALDWTVSSGDLDGKPVALITAATGGEKAHAALLPTLDVLSGNNVVASASFVISFIRAKMDSAGQITDPTLSEKLKTALDNLLAAIAHKD